MGLLFRFFRRKNFSKAVLLDLQRKVNDLEQLLQENVLIDKEAFKQFLEQRNSSSKETSADVHIEHLQVDQIIIEKLEYANNFGQLGIKELTGKLNIGTHYEGNFSKEITEKLNEKFGSKAKVNFRSSSDNKK